MPSASCLAPNMGITLGIAVVSGTVILHIRPFTHAYAAAHYPAAAFTVCGDSHCHTSSVADFPAPDSHRNYRANPRRITDSQRVHQWDLIILRLILRILLGKDAASTTRFRVATFCGVSPYPVPERGLYDVRRPLHSRNECVQTVTFASLRWLYMSVQWTASTAEPTGWLGSFPFRLSQLTWFAALWVLGRRRQVGHESLSGPCRGCSSFGCGYGSSGLFTHCRSSGSMILGAQHGSSCGCWSQSSHRGWWPPCSGRFPAIVGGTSTGRSLSLVFIGTVRRM